MLLARRRERHITPRHRRQAALAAHLVDRPHTIFQVQFALLRRLDAVGGDGVVAGQEQAAFRVEEGDQLLVELVAVVADRIDFRVGSVEEQTPSADFVCANLTAPVIVELLPALSGATCGRLVLSGILDSQIEMVQRKLAELGIADSEIDQDGEWVAIVV